MLQREHHEQANVDEERACGVGSQAETAQLHEAGHRQNQPSKPRNADRVGQEGERQYACAAADSQRARAAYLGIDRRLHDWIPVFR